MEISHLVAFNIALFAAIISPGPAFLIAVQNTLSSGRGAGIATGVGLGLVGALWTTAALLGLDIVFTLFPWAYLIVKTVGASYLIYIAYSMWCGARDPIKTSDKPTKYALRQGMMINALNPKTVLFAAAVLAVIFPKELNIWESGIVIANHFLFEVLFYSVLAFGMSRKAVSNGYIAMKFYIDRVSAAVLGLLGGRILLSR